MRSVRPLSGNLIAREDMVRVDRPRNRKQRQDGDNGQYFHGLKLVLDCGQKCQRSAHFQDDPGKDHDRPAPTRRTSHKPQFRRTDTREDAMESGSLEPVHAPEQAGEHRPNVGQSRV